MCAALHGRPARAMKAATLTGSAVIRRDPQALSSLAASMELDGNGNITSQNNRGSFVALDEEVLAAIKTLKDAVNARL